MKLATIALAGVIVSSPVWAKPNLIVILTDDQETGSIVYMPKLRQLIADQGVTFNNSFVSFPLCAPSRASLMTGQAAHNHGITSNKPRKGGGWQEFRDREGNTLPVWLQQAGYTTALLGKYVNGYGMRDTALKNEAGEAKDESRSDSVVDRMWSYVDRLGAKISNPNKTWVPAGWDLWFAFTVEAGYYDYMINENGTLHAYGDTPSDYSTAVLKDRAVRFIQDQSHAAKPFFMLITPKAPHGEGQEGKAEHAAVPSPRHKDLFADVEIPETPAVEREHATAHPKGLDKHLLKKEYRAALQSLQSVDDLVEAVVAALERTGQLNNTIIIYTSDNGFLFGEHGRRGKVVPFEGSIRVPLMMRGPGIPVNQTRDQLVNNLDLAATIIDLAGASPGVVLDGRSLVPVIADANASWRTALLIEHSLFFSGLRTDSQKYIAYTNGNEELYDLAADPYELHNRVLDDSKRDRLELFRSTLKTLASCKGDECWVP